MTQIPARLLKPIADSSPNCPALSPRDEKRRAHILDTARDSFLQYGFRQITMPVLAYATGYSQTYIRRQYGDLENLLGIVLRAYLDTLMKAVLDIPATPDAEIFPRRREAYLQATRGFAFTPTPMHFLLVQDRFFLPGDLLADIDMLRGIIGRMLGGDEWDATLALLDTPGLSREKIENALAGLRGQPPRVATEQGSPALPDATQAPQPEEAPHPPRNPVFASLRAQAVSAAQADPPPARDRSMFPRMTPEEAARTAIRTLDPVLGAMRDEDLGLAIARPSGARPHPAAPPPPGTQPPPQPDDAVLLDSLPLQRMSPASPQVRPHAA